MRNPRSSAPRAASLALAAAAIACAAAPAWAHSPGRMTGGGAISCGFPVGHAFTLNCGSGELVHWPFDGANPPEPNRLHIGWAGGNHFRLTELVAGYCSGDAATKPKARFNTIEGYGLGKLNGQPATIAFVFTDEGEPGKGVDRAGYTILDAAGGVVIDCEDRLERGNQQAHKAKGKKGKSFDPRGRKLPGQ